MELQIESFMTEEEIENTGIRNLNEDQIQAILNWSLKMYSLGQHHVSNIEEVKYGGRLIILEDGSKWEVDDIDASTSEYWESYQKVLVYEDEMYLIEDCEKVSVTEED